MQANCSTVAGPGAALVLAMASVAGLAGSAASVPTHEPTDGADDGAVLSDLNVS
jgi:hypothetical protein